MTIHVVLEYIVLLYIGVNVVLEYYTSKYELFLGALLPIIFFFNVEMIPLFQNKGYKYHSVNFEFALVSTITTGRRVWNWI